MAVVRSYHHPDLKRELVRISLATLAESGLEAFSVAQVARRAGVSGAAPYRHFEDGDALLAAAAVEIGGSLADGFADASGRADPDPARRLAATAGAYTRFMVEHGVGLDLVFAQRFAPQRFEAVHVQSRRIMAVLMALAYDANPSDDWTSSLALLQSHLALALGFATVQRNGSPMVAVHSADDLARAATEASVDLIRGFRLRFDAQQVIRPA